MVHGHVEGPFWRVARALETQLLRSGGGGAVCIYHRGHKVVDAWGGTRDERGSPWREDTLAMSFSTSKGVVATLLHVLAERGLLDYEDPVAKHWPEFGARGKAKIRVRELLSHRAGLPRIRPLLDHGERILDWDYMVRALERAEADPVTKGRSAYHAFTFGWLAGELAQRVAGKSLRDLLRTELVEPLGLDGLFIGATGEAKRRAAVLPRPRQIGSAVTEILVSDALLRPARLFWRALGVPVDPLLLRDALLPPGSGAVLFGPRGLDTPVPSANGLFTARSLARLYALLAAGGRLDGVRLLSPRTLARATQVQSQERDRVIPLRMGWRLGYHAVYTTRGHLPGAFGHYGYGGSGAFADPRRGLAVAMVNNRPGGGPFGDFRIAAIGAAAVAAADARP